MYDKLPYTFHPTFYKEVMVFWVLCDYNQFLILSNYLKHFYLVALGIFTYIS